MEIKNFPVSLDLTVVAYRFGDASEVLAMENHKGEIGDSVATPIENNKFYFMGKIWDWDDIRCNMEQL